MAYTISHPRLGEIRCDSYEELAVLSKNGLFAATPAAKKAVVQAAAEVLGEAVSSRPADEESDTTVLHEDVRTDVGKRLGDATSKSWAEALVSAKRWKCKKSVARSVLAYGRRHKLSPIKARNTMRKLRLIR